MIPVRVPYQQMDPPDTFLQEFLSERTGPSAAIQKDNGTVVGAEFDTGGIATIPRRFRSRSGYRTSSSPKSYFHPEKDRLSEAIASQANAGVKSLAMATSENQSPKFDRRPRSEERRVGKECRYRWWTDDYKKSNNKDAKES